MEANKNNWESKIKMQNILVACKINMISVADAEKLMMGLLNESCKEVK